MARPKIQTFIDDLSELPGKRDKWRDILNGTKQLCGVTCFGEIGIWYVAFELTEHDMVICKIYDFDSTDSKVDYEILLHPERVYLIGDRSIIPFQTIDIAWIPHFTGGKDRIMWELTFYVGYRNGYDISLPYINRPKSWKEIMEDILSKD